MDGRRREFDAGPARTLFATRAFFPANSNAYEVTSDGQGVTRYLPVGDFVTDALPDNFCLSLVE